MQTMLRNANKLDLTFCFTQIINKHVKVWNSLPETVTFNSLGSFKYSISDIDFTDFLK